ncbi:MAG: hypothetical protein ABL895_20655 [Cyclobacteriaceae bacterium]
MKKIVRFSWVYTLVGVALCSILFSFASSTGAHSVQVYLDSKLVIDQYIHSKMDAPKLILDPAEKHGQLIVKYSECGRTVTGRMITLKDENNKVLKDWHYEGASAGFKEPMSCFVKDIMMLKPKESSTLKLYYSSKEFPEGQQIAFIAIDDKTTTASK